MNTAAAPIGVRAAEAATRTSEGRRVGDERLLLPRPRLRPAALRRAKGLSVRSGATRPATAQASRLRVAATCRARDAAGALRLLREGSLAAPPPRHRSEGRATLTTALRPRVPPLRAARAGGDTPTPLRLRLAAVLPLALPHNGSGANSVCCSSPSLAARGADAPQMGMLCPI